MTWRVDIGDCVELMKGLEPCSVDAMVTDPPYLLGFMGRDWDTVEQHAAQDWHERWAREALRVLKPGGHLLAFGGTRTYHRLACAIEDAGFEIRDTIAWLYGSGFPKSLDVSKAIDKAAGHVRSSDYVPNNGNAVFGRSMGGGRTTITDPPATPDAERWSGWGTALKPAHEPVVVARKPLAGTVAASVLEHGTGAINVDGCRIRIDDAEREVIDNRSGAGYGTGVTVGAHQGRDEGERFTSHATGRWPANVILDEEAASLLDEQTGDRPSGASVSGAEPSAPSDHPGWGMGRTPFAGYGDSGGASRFFYCAKAGRAERNAGLGGFEEQHGAGPRRENEALPLVTAPQKNTHPTVKPIALMRYLVRLVTPPGGLVLDPFTGSGTTGIAALLEGFRFLGLERDPDYAAIAQARLRFWQEHGDDGLRIVAERERAEAEREAILATGQLDLLAEPA